MSATVIAPAPPWATAVPAAVPVVARVAMLGTGAVGTAFLQRLQRFPLPGAPGPRIVHVANSRRAVSASAGIAPADAVSAVAASVRPSRLDDVEAALGRSDTAHRVVVDATASAEVALRHPYWLERGIHVTTACKIAAGGPLSQAWRLAGAAQRGGTSYGDSATVGAGLPILRTIRELRRGGDAIVAISGVLSGSLGWLFDEYDGSRPFSELVQRAQALGYTEPDPRDDLSGEDVRRKLLILTRAAGVSLEPSDVVVEPLLGREDSAVSELTHRLAALDSELAQRLATARTAGRVLRYVARWDSGGARVALEAVDRADPLAPANGCDNRVAITSSRYDDSPLILQGPGAGPSVTAAALLDDVLRAIRN